MTTPSPVNGACGCPVGSVWASNSTFTGCLPCSDTSVSQAQCLSPQCATFVWSIFGKAKFCTSCALLGGTVRPNNTCICANGSYWDSATSYCYDCASATAVFCGKMASCSQYYLDSKQTCQPCGSTTTTRVSATPQTVCTCASGFSWSASSASCIKSTCTSSQYNMNGVCTECPTLNVLQSSKKSVANGSVCVCLSNYQFFSSGGTYVCGCDATLGSFDLGNQAGCTTCQKIAGAVSFDPALSQCKCIAGSSWDSPSSSCKCSTANSYFKFGTLCTSCTDPSVNGLLVSPSDATACTCDTLFVWSATLSQCICKTAGQYYNTASKSCKACTSSTIVNFNQCKCGANQYWDPIGQNCVCTSGSISINLGCLSCTLIPFGVAPSPDGKSCTCQTNWVWNSTKNACVCKANFNCDCSSLPDTGFSATSLGCVPCSTLDAANALSTWPAGQTQCGCNSIKYVWQLSTSKCVCNNNNASVPAILVGTTCVLCDRAVSSIGSINGSIPSSSCRCFPNYLWTATKFRCTYNTKGTGVVNLAISGGPTDKTCSAILTAAVSASAVDNFNCLCVSKTSIFNDLTGKCVSCGTLGSLNSVTCKCATGQAWSILMMKCISSSPPGGLYDNPSYAKCVQTVGLASANLLAFTFTSADSNQVIVSGESDFAALANQSPLYAPFAAFKCDCAAGYGWNSARRRCYSVALTNTY
ncbi:uncharacterized protein LOC116268055 [Nymphaea colorata]|uniref:uncharacterized protein LOC116268055 n=1 Tax=Nymphaea colorata TaxID=210225 RepID=UPI00129DA4BF|nr:uncharacterized protein LOC116268055 [Nymphaea colorata]